VTDFIKFTADEQQVILQMRDDGMSVRSISAKLKCADRRVRLFLNYKDEYNTSHFFSRFSRTSRTKRESESAPVFSDCDIPVPFFEDAPCRQFPTDWWFPRSYNDMNGMARATLRKNTQNAQRTCLTCKYQIACLDYALSAEPFGIWGGTTEAERVYIRNRARIECARNGKVFIAGIKTTAQFGRVRSDRIEGLLSDAGRSYLMRNNLMSR
jgi:hypothetical protein